MTARSVPTKKGSMKPRNTHVHGLEQLRSAAHVGTRCRSTTVSSDPIARC